jgi:hypothetical protein
MTVYTHSHVLKNSIPVLEKMHGTGENAETALLFYLITRLRLNYIIKKPGLNPIP